MEQYLIDQYGVIEDENYLTDEGEIIHYFENCGSDYLDCGQGYYEEETSLICKIEERYFEVNITGYIVSAKQDYGDKLYWVEYIDEVTYREIPKPFQKPEYPCVYSFKLTDDQARKLREFCNLNNIKFEYKTFDSAYYEIV